MNRRRYFGRIIKRQGLTWYVALAPLSNTTVGWRACGTLEDAKWWIRQEKNS